MKVLKRKKQKTKREEIMTCEWHYIVILIFSLQPKPTQFPNKHEHYHQLCICMCTPNHLLLYISWKTHLWYLTHCLPPTLHLIIVIRLYLLVKISPNKYQYMSIIIWVRQMQPYVQIHLCDCFMYRIMWIKSRASFTIHKNTSFVNSQKYWLLCK